MKRVISYGLAVLILLPLALAVGPVTYNYNTKAQFDTGTLFNLDTSNGDLRLGSNQDAFPFLWIANAGESSVSKVDTRLGKEVARYWTGTHAPLGQVGGEFPSRTAVDIFGNAWVGNRLGDRTVVKIAVDSRDCIDKNADGDNTDTSIDSNGNGFIDSSEVLAWGSDECVIKVVNFDDLMPAPCQSDCLGPRAIAVDSAGNVWVGLSKHHIVVKLDATTGERLAVIDTTQNGKVLHPFGAAFDIVNDVNYVWFIDKDQDDAGPLLGSLGKINADTNVLENIYSHPESQIYGLTLDKYANYLWLGGSDTGGLSRFDKTTNNPNAQFKRYPLLRKTDRDAGGNVISQTFVTSCTSSSTTTCTVLPIMGVAIDKNGKVWGGGTWVSEHIYRFNPATEQFDCFLQIPPMAGKGRSNPWSVLSDGRDGIWAVDRDGGVIRKIDVDACSLATSGGNPIVVNVGADPYTYSDAAGANLNQFITQGTWTTNVPAPPSNWPQTRMTIDWIRRDNIPSNQQSVIVESKKVGDADFTSISKGTDFITSGVRNVRFTLKLYINPVNRNDKRPPIVDDVSFSYECVPTVGQEDEETNFGDNLDNDCDGDTDCDDLAALSEPTCKLGCSQYSGNNDGNEASCNSATSIAKTDIERTQGTGFCDSTTKDGNMCTSYTCKCAWQENKDCLAEWTSTQNTCGSGGGGTEQGSCTIVVDANPSLCLTQTSYPYKVTAVWVGATLPAREKCVDVDTTILCASTIDLNFFEWKQFALAILLLAGVYFVFVNVRKH